MDSEQRISDEAVEKATGYVWDHWMKFLDEWGAKEKPHKETALYLEGEHGVSPWWAQTVTVHYEKARGLRKTGQDAAGEYQVGVMKTMGISPQEAWKKITGKSGLWKWLGEGAPPSLKEGQRFTLEDGTQVEVRVVEPGSHVRLFWHPPRWKKRSVVQVRVLPRDGGRAAIQFHQEKMPTRKNREGMRAHWKGRLGELQE